MSENKASESGEQANLESVINRFMGGVRHAHVLGIELLAADKNGVRLLMPYQDKIVGNPVTGVIHGGALTTLMDQALGTSIICAIFPEFDITPTIDLRMDHMKPATPGKDIRCYASAYRVTSNVVFTRGFAYHDDENDPLCHCVGTFMRMGFSRTKDGWSINAPVPDGSESAAGTSLSDKDSSQKEG